MNASPATVAQRRALAAHRLGDEEWRSASMRERRRVELVELHVRDFRPGFEGQRDAVAGRHLRDSSCARTAGPRRRWRAPRAGAVYASMCARCRSIASTPGDAAASTMSSRARACNRVR